MTDDFTRQLKARARVNKLMTLAEHPDTPPHEAANAKARAEKLAAMYQIPLVGGPVTRPPLRPTIDVAAAKANIGGMFDMFRGSIKKQHPVSYLDEKDDDDGPE